MAGRSLQNLETFVVTNIQSSTTLTAADKQSLLSDFFNLISRSSSMGGLLKELFGIQPAPAPVPPTPISKKKLFLIQIHLSSMFSNFKSWSLLLTIKREKRAVKNHFFQIQIITLSLKSLYFWLDLSYIEEKKNESQLLFLDCDKSFTVDINTPIDVLS